MVHIDYVYIIVSLWMQQLSAENDRLKCWIRKLRKEKAQLKMERNDALGRKPPVITRRFLILSVVLSCINFGHWVSESCIFP